MDVDGVLHPHGADEPFVPSCMENIKQVVNNGVATLVLSSSWRENRSLWKELNKEMKKLGLDAITEATPISEAGTVDNFVSRSDEIIEWLMRHPNGTNFVKTSSRTGMTDADVQVALDKLNLLLDRST